MRYFMGIDGGGTGTRAWLANAHGRVLGTGVAGPANHHLCGLDAAVAAIRAAAAQAVESATGSTVAIDAAFIGLAGMSGAPDRARMAAALGAATRPEPLAAHIEIDHDLRAALCGGLAGAPGIVLIAGTGSSCYGRDATGSSARTGGWGAVADDAGSAGWIARRALEVAVRQHDGRYTGRALRDAVFEFLGATGRDDFARRVTAPELTHDALAKLCPRIVELAQGGDGPANAIVAEAVAALVELVSVTAAKLALPQPVVVLAGGLATSDGYFQRSLEAALRATLPECRIEPAALPPVGGAVIEAARAAGVAIDAKFLANLRGGLPRQL